MSDLKKNELVTVRITEMNNMGCGVGHIEEGNRAGSVIFVRGTVTGETVQARIIKLSRTYAVGRCEAILTPSPLRADKPFCDAPQACGGCVYRNVSYEHELSVKREYVANAFRKAGLADVAVAEVQHTGKQAHYRNKAQYPLRMGKNGIETGFYATGTHTVIPSASCMIGNEVFSPIAQAFCRIATKLGLSVYDEHTGKGLLRHLYLRIGEQTGQIMVCIIINGSRLPSEEAIRDELCALFPDIVSILININQKNTNVIMGERTQVVYGTPYIEDILCGKRFRISAESFYQVNRDGAELLYTLAAELSALDGTQTLIDLYCGTGTVGLSMSDKARRLVGVEIVPEAVACARINAEQNGTQNAEFVCADASDIRKAPVFHTVDAAHSVVVIDPPRKGSTREVITFLSDKGFSRIVYISCDPDTLARDAALFRELGYEIGTVYPVDMFPRTGHVESVVCLKRQIQQ